MNKLEYTQNRELSWLRFNQRVLEEAKDESVPLLERMKFVAIFTSNLDEFFMIRVGSLTDLAAADSQSTDSTGLTYLAQLDEIYKAVAPLYKERDKVYRKIKKKLSPYGVIGLNMKELEEDEKEYVRTYLKEEMMPMLSPQIVDITHPFPHLQNKAIYVIANLMKDGEKRMGIVQVPSFISDVLYLPGKSIRYVRMEKIIMTHLDVVFEHYEITDKNYICVTRNADVAPDDETFAVNEDFRLIMQNALKKRMRMAAVRLEVFSTLSEEMEEYLSAKLGLDSKCIFRTKMPLKLDYIFSIAEKIPISLKKHLIYNPYLPQASPYEGKSGAFALLRRRDILLHYPYESMELFFKLMREASTNKDVLSIKITIYRLARQSRLVEYLCAAAENGKEVIVLIELRARFDEQNNIDWSQRLEEAGCKVIYGMEGFKVHSKICLITYRYRGEIGYITQIGTGNYNEKTAKQYTDYSLMTSSKEIGEDASTYFRNMSTQNLHGSYKHFIVSPFSLKESVLSFIDHEISKGKNGRVVMKMNSVTDMDFIEKIREASRAGVQIDLIVRGICCILPGVKGHTENLTVTSIVGRYLEHHRVFVFGEGEEQRIYLSSADMMTRNTQKRVEVACPIYAAELKKRIANDLELMLRDNVKARRMDNAGVYHKIKSKGESVDSQAIFMEMAVSETRSRQSVDNY